MFWNQVAVMVTEPYEALKHTKKGKNPSNLSKMICNKLNYMIPLYQFSFFLFLPLAVTLLQSSREGRESVSKHPA